MAEIKKKAMKYQEEQRVKQMKLEKARAEEAARLEAEKVNEGEERARDKKEKKGC